MSRIPRLGALQSLHARAVPAASPARIQFASISTTIPARDLRSRLWKGEAPGPEDPYTQRAEPVLEESSNSPSARVSAAGGRSIKRRRDPNRLVVPPKRTEARSEKDITHNDSTYTPATSLKDLATAPTLQNWWDQPGHMGQESRFAGFAHGGSGSGRKVVDREVVEVHLRRAVVEVLALQQVGKLSEWATRRWSAAGDIAARDEALSVSINVAEDNTASLDVDASAIVDGLTAAEEEGATNSVGSLTAKDAVKLRTWDSSWESIVLEGDEVKFALRKRVYQLTGNLIPDAKLGPIRTVKHILTMASKQPKPKELAKVLASRADIGAVPNLTLHRRRVTPIDKEKSVGRWKVITEELVKRGLPVTGTGGLPAHREKAWLRQIN